MSVFPWSFFLFVCFCNISSKFANAEVFANFLLENCSIFQNKMLSFDCCPRVSLKTFFYILTNHFLVLKFPRKICLKLCLWLKTNSPTKKKNEAKDDFIWYKILIRTVFLLMAVSINKKKTCIHFYLFIILFI